MTKDKFRKYRELLDQMAERIRGDASALEGEARVPTGGETSGNLSNVPMHLADLGTEAYMQELNATLLENEGYLVSEIAHAYKRMEQGTYGHCENCGKAITAQRLETLPYTSYCAKCAAKLQPGQPVNLNDGRPRSAITELTKGEPQGSDEPDHHAVGTPGGGSAIGGLAGTNIGGGDPIDVPLEEAMGSGNFDVEAEDEDEAIPYSGRTGGAVGGTPAGKRTVGGKRRE